MRPGCVREHDDRRLVGGLAHVDDVGLDALVVVVALVVGLLGRRQQRLDAFAQLDERVARVALLDRPGHRLADTVRVLLEDPLALGVADDRADDVLGVLGGDSGDVAGRDVALVVGRGLAGLLVDLADGDELVDVDPAGLAVDGDARRVVEIENALIGRRE